MADETPASLVADDKLTRLVVVRLKEGTQRLWLKTADGANKKSFAGMSQNLSGQLFTHT